METTEGVTGVMGQGGHLEESNRETRAGSALRKRAKEVTRDLGGGGGVGITGKTRRDRCQKRARTDDGGP